ncbi:SSU ribosomal protein S12P methylthiotransferase [Clostridium amylolyticum]|uniref:Ribosomal protein uS12 methylthiotransferase RimO n=1 Tax=Clostridium amylolyticum TaxID=1121298 RepID=A0A1M6DD12_9CLOT|nr:SSU ribosomal protein S12P methylthiotransferase [Clostridium amylolyticum]
MTRYVGGANLQKYKVGIISLGCDKNRIDSEIMLGSINKDFELTNKAEEADIIIINTCGFIEKAKQESINTILEMAEFKNKGNCKLLMATGCLTQRYGEELAELIPEIDVMLGVNDYIQINKFINEFIKNNKRIINCNYSDENINEGERIITTNKMSAYVRIAEGCDNYCTYCIIPKIRGKYRSRSMESILKEVNELVSQGVKEIILIAQDTTRYGMDLYGAKHLHSLIKDISKIPGVEWIRLLYCYPEELYDELIQEIASNKKVCNYLDLPIQHISNDVLKLMGRKTSKESILNIINTLRKNIPDIKLRTSIIVGFPGETEDNFKELKEFIEEIKFDNLGVFRYSKEEGSAAALMKDQIEENIKKQREKELMKLQKEIVIKLNQENVGKIYDVLIESENEEFYIGRNQGMAPDIDGMIFIDKKNPMNVGDIIPIKIMESTEYDLIGVVYYESSK